MLAMNGNELKLLGGTMDLHAGQLVDRIGVRMGLPFPAGPHLEKMALQGQAQAILPVWMPTLKRYWAAKNTTAKNTKTKLTSLCLMMKNITKD